MKNPLIALFFGVCLLSTTSYSPASSAATGATSFAPQIVRLDSRLNRIVPPTAVLEKVAEGFTWAEGPVWNRAGGYLLFSDVPTNSIIKWKAGEGASVFLKPSGHTGKEPFAGREPGSNGLTFDDEGRLVFCQHGDRRVGRLEKDGSRTGALLLRFGLALGRNQEGLSPPATIRAYDTILFPGATNSL